MTDNSLFEQLTPAILMKKKSDAKNSLANLTFFRRKIHNDWMLKILYIAEINAFVSCSLESEKSLVIGDLDRKTVRSVSIPKGVKCFEFCRRPSFLITGGRDKTLSLWNPYVLSKPAGSLVGHNSPIINIKVNNDEGHIISLSEDKVCVQISYTQ
jgi:WD40 repeat protein